ncbi:TPA_asm: hypothetical protein G4J96_000697 [Salmonella enterica subsp. enterica serovar Java]|uniref:Uncharacterized protein n=1 Tax=Salmonella enterica subsp. enterica serovar Java TaxID=224729 RepID=A0A732U8I2_SALEB|nr:hypothetical protein [Salmonella enterica subsp. enterica serovar Java]HAE5380779.1 hypothetical protein [Salmonella enterica subsp. enterica serovar Java]
MAAYDIEKDIGPRVQIIQEIHELILAGEMEVAKGMLKRLDSCMSKNFWPISLIPSLP